MSARYSVRLATSADLPLLPGIERAAANLFADFGLAALFATILTPARDLEEGMSAGRLWVATDAGGTPVGFALASVVGANAHLEELDVHPDHGRRGVGRALVETVTTWARGTGFPGVTLTTLGHVPWNAPFYERLGFRVLTSAELGDALRDLLRSEVARGLPSENRVAMLKEL